ncbi:MAG TPA: S4 domain-containing protein, partial [Pyrinomonadaceae bacterium]
MHSSDQTAAASPDVRLTVHEADAGKRLDAYLAAHIPDWSRVRLQRLIEGEDVLVNGRPVKSSYKLRNKDEVELDLVPAPAADFIPEN